MQLNRIPKMVSYKERVYNELKQAIVRNELKPGEMLNERTLAENLGISRTPVREALQWLEKEGWVETEPCRGTWVRKIMLEDIAELYQMRKGLETLAVELAIQSIDDSRRAQIRRMVEDLAQMDFDMEHKDFINMDIEFHLYLAKITGNRLLYQSMNSLMDMMTMYVIQTFIRKTDPYSVPINEHIEMLRSILEGDVDRGRAAVEKHIKRAYEAATGNMGS